MQHRTLLVFPIWSLANVLADVGHGTSRLGPATVPLRRRLGNANVCATMGLINCRPRCHHALGQVPRMLSRFWTTTQAMLSHPERHFNNGHTLGASRRSSSSGEHKQAASLPTSQMAQRGLTQHSGHSSVGTRPAKAVSGGDFPSIHIGNLKYRRMHINPAQHAQQHF